MKPAGKVLLLTVLLAGAGTKIFRESWLIDNVQGPSDPCARGDAKLYYHFIPGCTEDSLRAGRRYHVAYNALGLRERDFTASRAPGRPRVLVVGPSLLVTPGLAESEMPTRIAEASLRARGKDIEIINAATMGYSAVQSSLKLKSYLRAYDPELVVFFLTVESAGASVMLRRKYWNPGSEEEGGSYFPDASTRFSPASAEWLYRSGLNRWLTTFDLFFRRWWTSWLFLFSSDDSNAELALGPTLEAVKLMQQVCADRKIPLLVTFQDGEEYRNAFNITNEIVAPLARIFEFFTPRNILPAEVVRSYFARNGVSLETVTMVASPSVAGAEKFRLPGDIHLNELGSGKLGADLARLIETSERTIQPSPRSRGGGSPHR